LKDKVKSYAERINSFNNSFETHSKRLMHNKEKLMSIDTNYGYYSKQMSDILKKIEYNSKDRNVDFYDEKLFHSLNSKMKTVDIRAKEVEFQTNSLNNLITEFNEEMVYHVKEINEMEDERFQSLLDSLNQMNVFQTNYEMNNKYDTNNFNEGVGDIKKCEVKTEVFKQIDTYTSQVFDELMTKEDYDMHGISQEEENK
jgi:predicted  nucleic acid-binding Zn-ribbon protein